MLAGVFHALDHVIVGVRELEEAADAYTRLLGRSPSWRGDHPQLGTANALFRLHNTYLELLSPSPAGEGEGEGGFARLLRERLERDGEGLFALALATDDAEACASRLRERGIAAADPEPGEGRARDGDTLRKWRNVGMPLRDTRGVSLLAIEHLSPDDALPQARADGDEKAAVEGLDHVVIQTGDADSASAFWGERLGIRLALDRSFEARGVRLLFFRLGGVTIELAARLDATGGGDRLQGLAWQVPDVVAGRERVAKAGFDVSETRPGNKPGTRVCSVRAGTHGVPTLLIGPG